MSQTKPTTRLNIIGCGHLGQTLAYLWAQVGLNIGQVLNTSLLSSQAAVRFIGQGQAIETISELKPADLYLLGCPDKALETCCAELAQTQVLREGTIVFHCSGAIASDILQPLKEQGAYIASVHPIKSFAQPKQAVLSFQPTYCGVEGDAEALAVLEPWFQQIGGISFKIDARQKTLYHAASVFACNYLVALQSISLRAFALAGVEQELALKILQPIVQDTVANLFKLGSVDALTGPIARGDAGVVAKQLAALKASLPLEAEVYRLLGLEALQLAREKQTTPEAYLQEVAKVLAVPSARVD
ncbi:Rossmann-like and DUF2520 domain-containing protein [uncultured Thiothrix sp.]|uniref:Rossmann-like and DUF2520 domain-containing protein n=1 Tax=uncultured Thiothrix sp. TaxID=223185 RepID=UPI00261AF7F6|nr:Rossmann-like and DUF2520 domain-containing protein [uncultured Thiothrix sp.]